MVPFPVVSTLVSWVALGFKTPDWKFSGFFPGIEQGARIGCLKSSSFRILGHFPPNNDELFFVLFEFLSRHRWSFRIFCFGPVKFFSWNLLVSQHLLFFLSVDFPYGVIRLSTILARPCHMLLGTHMLAVLARLRW